MKIRPSQLLPTGTRRTDAQDSLGSSLGATDLLGDTMEAMRTITGKIPTTTPVRRGARACGEHPHPWNKKPYLWEKASHTSSSATAKPGKHPRAWAGALLWATCWQGGLTSSVRRAKCVGKHGRTREPRILRPEDSQGVTGLSGLNRTSTLYTRCRADLSTNPSILMLGKALRSLTVAWTTMLTASLQPADTLPE